MQNFLEADRAPAWLEIKSIEQTGVLYCRSPVIKRDCFADLELQRCWGGWKYLVERSCISFAGQKSLGTHSRTLSVQTGAALLPEEERTLFLWQGNGSIVIASEDSEWNKQLKQITAPRSLIRRPGADTLIWLVAERSLFLCKSRSSSKTRTRLHI